MKHGPHSPVHERNDRLPIPPGLLMPFDWREYLRLAGFLHATAGA